MSKFHRRLTIRVTAGFYIMLAFALVTVSLKWIAMWFFAAAVHELGHVIAVTASGHKVYALNISWTGAQIRTNYLGNDEWYCALAGPVFGLLLVHIARYTPGLALCAILQSLVNLLPFYPLDGGRAVRGIARNLCGEEYAIKISRIVSIAVVIIIAVLVYRAKDGTMLVVLISALIINLLKMLLRKIPCKRGGKWVQ